MDATLQKLVLIYSGAVLINAIRAAALWYERRDALTRAQFLVWATTALGFVTQAVLAGNNLVITLGYSFVFLVSLAIAQVLSLVTKVVTRPRLFYGMMGGGLVLAGVAYAAGLPFFAVALPVAVGVAFPSLYMAVATIWTRWRELSTSGKGLVVSVTIYGLHMLDFAVLRDKPAATAGAFTAGMLIIFTLSIFVPAAVLETVTRQQARVAAEMDVARRIQTELLPRNPTIPGLELACYMKPADEVGGDYYDVHCLGDRAWILVGDVTGHGLSSGLVMLMAQSIISAILHAHPDITPSALNALANSVLYQNLRRLNEDRMMTIVSIRIEDRSSFSLSGCHDNVYIHRETTGEVETISVSQLPCGLGFVDEITADTVGEESYRLNPGDTLFIITDGVTEAARAGNYESGMFNEERLIALIKSTAGLPVDRIKAALMRELEEFTGGIFHDDVTFLIARCKA